MEEDYPLELPDYDDEGDVFYYEEVA